MKLLLDSNIWIRYLVRDEESSFQASSDLLKMSEQGLIRPYISTIILLEIYWVLTTRYRVLKNEAQKDIEKISSMRRLVIFEKTNFRQAFSLHKRTGVKLADCLIATQVGQGITLVTYDREFRKLPGLAVAEPAEILKAMK